MRDIPHKLASLPGLRLVPWSDHKWQKSSATSALFWVLNTLLIFRLVEYFGHGVRTSILVSLGWDLATFAVNKFWIWRTSRVGLKVSYFRNFAVWLVFFGLNASLFWILHDPGNQSVHTTRYILGGLGILINPWRFRINQERIFQELKTEIK